MYEDSSDEDNLNDVWIDISELKKEFNASEFARSLLPRVKLYGDEEEDQTDLVEFLDNLGEKLEINDISPVKNDFNHLRTWSHVKFKKKQVSETPKTIQENSKVQNETNAEKTDHEEIQNISFEQEVVKNDTNFLQNFLEAECEAKVQNSDLDCIHNTSDLPLIKRENRRFFRFYYLDAYEKHFGEESTVYLFGKTYCQHSSSFKSCCVVVTPLMRRLFVLPKENLVNENEGHISVRAIRMLKDFYKCALKPMNIKVFKYRFVRKKNLEGLFTSEEQIILEIEYSAHYPAVDSKLEGITFSKVLGSRNNCFENFLLHKNIKGPCWLDVSNPKKAAKAKTWCSFELTCPIEDISLCDSIDKSASPPITLFSFHTRCMYQSNNIALISWAVNFDYDIWNGNSSIVNERSYCTFTFVNSNENLADIPELKELKRTQIKKLDSEKELINFFLNKFNEIDPDIVVGYDIKNREFHKFLDRIESLKIEDSNKLSKFRSASNNSNLKQFAFSGRLICDLRHLAKELNLSRNYELNELLEKFLGIQKEQRWVVDFGKIFSPTGEFCHIVEHREIFLETFIVSTNEPLYLLKLVSQTNIICLAVKLTQICGSCLSQTFTGGLTKRIEYLLVHALNENNFIVPFRMFSKKLKQVEDEEILIGGLVLEPKVGFYDTYILLMDFESLYPSIIHEYNLCISHDELDEPSDTERPLGVLPKLMSDFIQIRRKVKDQMKSLDSGSAAHFRYNMYQTALKLSANGIYGCLASKHFRFHSPSIARDITRRAREILQNTADLLRNKGFEIIYGDTDSIMVNTKSTDLQSVNETGGQIREMVNSHYSSINLKVDAIFKKLLMIAKKKYAGIAVDVYKNETKDLTILKGLDIIRYDRPVYVCEVGKMIIDIILSDNSLPQIYEKIEKRLAKVREQFANNKVPKEKLVITKYLTQDPNSYPQDTKYPHVQVAVRLNENFAHNYKSGDAVCFIMCSDKEKTFSKKAFHPTELESMNNLEIDGEYYLHHHVYSFLANIFALIGLRNVEMEQYLCSNSKSNEIKEEKVNKTAFDSRQPFIFPCLKCGKTNLLEENVEVLYRCQNLDCDFCPSDNPSYLKNRLVLALRSYVQKYYKYEFRCTKCSYATLRIPLGYNKYNRCLKCFQGIMTQTYKESDLFLQIEYFKYILKFGLDIERKSDIFKSLLEVVNDFEKNSGFLSVDLTELFRPSI